MKYFATIKAADGEVLGVPISAINLITEFIGDSDSPYDKGPYCRIHWIDPNNNKRTWTTVKGTVEDVVFNINKGA